MQFDDVYPSGVVIDRLSEKCGCRVASVPFMDCMPRTSYLVSEDGKRVYVCVDFGGYCQVKEIAILPSGARSRNSKPAFVRRNRNGFRVTVSLGSAVYGAFVLGEIPKHKLSHIDGNPDNCTLGNLRIADSSILRMNIEKCTGLYQEKYEEMVNRILRFRRMSVGEAQDFVSQAFLRMCESRKEIDPELAPGLWLFLAKEKLITVYSRNKIEYRLYDALQNYVSPDCREEEMDLQKTLGRLPPDCRRAAELLLAGYNQSEIASRLRVAQSSVSRIMNKTKRILAKYDNQS